MILWCIFVFICIYKNYVLLHSSSSFQFTSHTRVYPAHYTFIKFPVALSLCYHQHHDRLHSSSNTICTGPDAHSSWFAWITIAGSSGQSSSAVVSSSILGQSMRTWSLSEVEESTRIWFWGPSTDFVPSVRINIFPRKSPTLSNNEEIHGNSWEVRRKRTRTRRIRRKRREKILIRKRVKKGEGKRKKEKKIVDRRVPWVEETPRRCRYIFLHSRVDVILPQ